MSEGFASFIMGCFDGLHYGHDSLFQKRTNPCGVMLVDNIPRKREHLFSLAERIEQIQHFYHPITWMVYDVVKNNLTGKVFIETFLKPLKINEIIVGSNFSFGNDFLTPDQLVSACKKLTIVPLKHGFSSSLIRSDLSQGDLLSANEKLLTCFFYEGTVIDGQKISRSLTYPTANFLIPPDRVKLHQGVYVSVSEIEHNFYESVTFVGQSKLLNDPQWNVQTHLLFENQNLYKKAMRTYFLALLSENEHFSELSQLKKKIDRDVSLAKHFFEQNPLSLNLVKWKIWNRLKTVNEEALKK